MVPVESWLIAAWGWQDALFYGRFAPLSTWGAATAVSLVALAAGWSFFHRLRDSFAEAV